MVHVVNDIEISPDRLMRRLDELAEIGAITGPRGHAGSSRLALTDDDRRGRDLVMTWMRDLGLDITVDAIGNVVGQMPSDSGLAPVMCGSHIDTVGTGGRFDGNLGVLAGLEVIESVMSSGVQLPRPLAVAFFTDEEGARFPPDMLGSLVYAGGMAVEAAQSIVAVDGTGATVGSELERIGYLGAAPCPGAAPHAFVELHIEQGPVLEQMGRRVGAVTGVQGISWTAVEVRGVSNHAGTTPMSMRCDPMFVVGHMTAFLRSLATEIGAPQVATVGRVELHPNLINVIPASATFTIDVRHTDDEVLREVEQRVGDELRRVAAAEGVSVSTETLARFEPVIFDERVVATVVAAARRRGEEPVVMPSGAGHDAQMLARMCPTAMIFTPSIGGISHNPAEDTAVDDLALGCQLLADVMLDLVAGRHFEHEWSAG